MAAEVLGPLGYAVTKIKAKTKELTEPAYVVRPPDNLIPILIFPGFMSSGLKVEKSPYKGWEGRRVWLNIAAAGFEKLNKGGDLLANLECKEKGKSYSESMMEEYEKEEESKSKWLKHLCLSEDMHNESEGIRVRPLKGLKAVDYLVPGGVVSNHISWVFSPVIKVLREAGYTDTNLDAAPYDWRVPPSVLESRDGFFSKTMKQVEQLYNFNDDKPVVMLCHSMGCKTGHYFLNFCLNHPEGGQVWIDKYIHTYMPIGAPHLGAPKAIRGTVAGDKMGLEAFLTDQEGLAVGRSLGSACWLYPQMLPSASTTPVAIMRREGTLTVSVNPFDCSTILRDRDYKDRPKLLRLTVRFGDQTVSTEFKEADSDGGLCFPETFVFPAPPTLPGKDHLFEIGIEEPGIAVAKREKLQGPFQNWVLRPMKKTIDCAICSVYACFPCLVVKEVVTGGANVVMSAADVVASAFGTVAKLAATDKTDLTNAFERQNPTQVMLKMMHVKDRRNQELRRIRVFRKTRSVAITVRLKWDPPAMDTPLDLEDIATPVGFPPDKDLTASLTLDPRLTAKNLKNVEYKSVSGNILLRSEGLYHSKDVMMGCFDNDPLGPRTKSSKDAPPVKRVKAVYGINLPTEVGAIYRKCSYIEAKDRIQMKHTTDNDASLKMEGFEVEQGVLLETEKSPQVIETVTEKKVIHASGDGTVPYWSLQQSRNWEHDCEVEIHELEKAEHREILKDERFHKILLDYVRQKKDGDSRELTDGRL